jgi:hypothetical protein
MQKAQIASAPFVVVVMAEAVTSVVESVAVVTGVASIGSEVSTPVQVVTIHAAAQLLLGPTIVAVVSDPLPVFVNTLSRTADASPASDVDCLV